MIIMGAGSKHTETIPQSISQSKMKKRGKVKKYSRRQLHIKQNGLMDKMLHVDARIENLQNVVSGMKPERKPIGKVGDARIENLQNVVSGMKPERKPIGKVGDGK